MAEMSTIGPEITGIVFWTPATIAPFAFTDMDSAITVAFVFLFIIQTMSPAA